MDNVIQQLGIYGIFSALYHPQSNGKLEVFYKYLKPTLKKQYENDPDNSDKYLNLALTSYCVTPHLATAETLFCLFYGRDPSLPLHQLLEPMQWFLGDPKSGCLDLESHHLALAIAKETLDENRFKHAQKTMDHTTPNFKVCVREYTSKKQASWKMRSKMENLLQDCPYRVQCMLPPYRKPSYRKNWTLQCQGCCAWTVELWEIYKSFS